MKLIIETLQDNIAVVKDFEEPERGEIGQWIVELELIKQELMEMYVG